MRVGAKLNLYLKVTGRRADGYHELSTVFLPLAEPADELTLELTEEPGLRLEVEGADTGEVTDNLVYRAAQLYAATAKIEPAWHFRLYKNIPVAAGLGGGSADAAAALLLLNRHYQQLNVAQLTALALKLGADVPFFLNPVPALATGVGEKLTPLPASAGSLHLLLLFPNFPVSAKWTYSHLTPSRIGPEEGDRLKKLGEALAAGDPAGIAAHVHNDLSFALLEKFPLLLMLQQFALRNGALAAEISGSGPTLFLILPGAVEQERLQQDIVRYFGDSVRVIQAETGNIESKPAEDRLTKE